jgi:TetR/AcrR family transcriptional regulator, transcriptional repressor for nem operon
MGRPSLRNKLLESGVTTLHRQGFAASGVRDITQAAGIPQGCFTNHFRSKEAFGVAVLERYYEGTEAILDATLGDETRRPIERLRAYFDVIAHFLEDAGWRHGCLISNMSLEAAEHSEALRACLDRLFKSLTQRFGEAVRAAQAAGEMRSDVDAEELADVMLAAWHGAMLRMKVERNCGAIERFKRIFFSTLLASSPPQSELGPSSIE